MDLTGIGEVATAAKGILGMIFPDKTEEEKAKIAAAMALVQAQTDIDKAEAQSTDPLQHWRGGLGWVCVLGYLYNFVVQPIIVDVAKLSGHAFPLTPLDIGPLSVLTLGMLGLGGMHVVQQINGK
jgi:Holin of 3TMs, for gene-transfer release